MEEKKLLKKKYKYMKENNKVLLASVCNDLAELYLREGKYESSIEEYKIEAKIYKETNQDIQYATVNRMIGEAYFTMGQFEKALTYQQIHLAVAKQNNNKLEEQRAFATIGRTYLTSAYIISDDCDTVDSENLNLAYKAFKKSLMICESLKDITKREQMDMRARLLLNIGVVYENQGKIESAIEYMMQAIKICKTNDIFDQLHQCYCTLGLLYSKIHEYSKALSTFNLAFEVATCLSDKVPPMIATLVAKAEVLYKLGDFQNAKNVLLKAHKLKSPNKEEKVSIERNLKVVASLYYTEESLLTIADSDFKLKKKLYEKMGDGACELKIFDKAIDYYKKMLEYSELSGESGKELIPVYVSLAQTYKDNKQYDLAIEYFEKEYQLCCDNPKESFNTFLNIAEVMELSKKDFNEIKKTYEKAKYDARATNDFKIIGKVIVRFISFLKKFGKFLEASELEKELSDIDYVQSDSEEENSESGTPNIGDDINISDISDISDDSDEENIDVSNKTRKRGRGFTFKKNSKGETPLHVACISGNQKLVQRLLEQGHPVNVRDNCGWIPLHEACNYGFTEIVKLLVQKGANINDRGGSGCKGMTPLHDACCNGHLDVIEYLLDKNASVLSKNDNGETPLDMLKHYRTQNNYDPIQQTYYETLVARMSSILEKTGRITQNKLITPERKSLTPKKSNSFTETTQKRSYTPLKSPHSNYSSPKIGSLRNIIDNGSSDEEISFSAKERLKNRTQEISSSLILTDSSSNDSNYLTSAKDEYKRVMENLRNRPENILVNPKTDLIKRSAFLSQDEIGDDWLEDDLNPSKKRKFRKSNSPFKKNYDFIENMDTDSNDIDKFKKKTQTKLHESGFSRKSITPEPIKRSFSSGSINKSKRQPKISNFTVPSEVLEPDSTTCVDTSLFMTSPVAMVTRDLGFVSQNVVNRNMYAISVKIENKLWRIPVPANEIDQLTIGWLANEASKRYYSKEGILPTLQLETKDGAILMNEDPLSLVFLTPTEPEEVQSTVLSWNLPPLPERYLEACSILKIDVDTTLREKLEETQGTLNLNLANFSLKKQIVPLFRSLNRQTNLQYIDISCTNLLNEGLQHLTNCLPSLDQLKSLNLSTNNINLEGLRYISDMFASCQKPILGNLTELNLSYNLLSDDCLRCLETILKFINLRSLNLCGCSLTDNIFDGNSYVNLNFSNLEDLDLSYNELDKNSICKFISFLNFKRINKINFANNSVTQSGILKEISLNIQQNIQILNLSRCKINDAEIWEFLRLTEYNVDKLNLSYNEDLTSVSLRRFIQHSNPPKSINFEGCDNILQYFIENEENIWKFNKTFSTSSLKTLKISVDCYEKIELLSRIWQEEWGTKAKIQKLFESFLILSVND